MQSDPGTEWERLTRLYAEKSDEEVLDLAEDFGNLTDVAQQVLRDEMRKRGLATPQTASGNASELRALNPANGERTASGTAESDAEARGNDDVDGEELAEYTWKTLLCECNERDEAWQIAEVLRRAGIESWIEGPRSRNDVRRPRVIVAADQLEEARAMIAQPIPQEIIDQSKVRVEDFELPVCPRCGASDPLLESVEPSNSWRCETCSARWSDPVTVESEGRNPA